MYMWRKSVLGIVVHGTNHKYFKIGKFNGSFLRCLVISSRSDKNRTLAQHL